MMAQSMGARITRELYVRAKSRPVESEADTHEAGPEDGLGRRQDAREP